jgi:hypothetical protein
MLLFQLNVNCKVLNVLFYCRYTIFSSRSVVQFMADVVMLLISNWARRN